MGGYESSWSATQETRINTERWVTAALFGFSLWGVVSNSWLILIGVGLVMTTHIRARALNQDDEQRAQRRIFLTNPIIEIGSVVVVFYLIATVVREYRPVVIADPLVGYAGAAIVLSLLFLLIERFSTGEYFAWWGERAIENAEDDTDGFWTFVASWCFKLSDREFSTEDMRRIRSRQRLVPGRFTPGGWRQQPPTPEWSWAFTFIRWLVSAGRVFAFFFGIIIIMMMGYSSVAAWALTTFVYVASSVLADNIKYIYHYQPLRDGYQAVPTRESWIDALVQLTRQYWVATVLSFSVVWIVL
jgi:hypothetical protein